METLIPAVKNPPAVSIVGTSSWEEYAIELLLVAPGVGIENIELVVEPSKNLPKDMSGSKSGMTSESIIIPLGSDK